MARPGRRRLRALASSCCRAAAICRSRNSPKTSPPRSPNSARRRAPGRLRCTIPPAGYRFADAPRPTGPAQGGEDMAESANRPHSHMQDFEAHIRAVEEELEYYRTKRFEPRVLYLHRRGVLTLYDLREAAPSAEPAAATAHAGDHEHDALEGRIRALEDRLDAYVKTIGLTGVPVRGTRMVIDDGRVERGDYDPAFRIAKKPHGGPLAERVAHLEADMSRYERLLHAFTRALVAAGALDPGEMDRQRAQIGQPSIENGARIVARAWVDPIFKQALIEKGREAVRELDIPPGRLGKMGVAENTPGVHNVVVCTLCSCYPYDLLGDTPWWYKSEAYREQIVRDPRGTLASM